MRGTVLAEAKSLKSKTPALVMQGFETNFLFEIDGRGCQRTNCKRSVERTLALLCLFYA
jgi:hypothetical protein